MSRERSAGDWTTSPEENQRRRITLPTLETKRKLDEEIFGDKADAEASGRDADRGADQASDGERGHPDDMRGAGAAADRGDGGRGHIIETIPFAFVGTSRETAGVAFRKITLAEAKELYPEAKIPDQDDKY